MTNSLTSGSPDRSKIDTHQAHRWRKHLRVSNDELARAIDRVGNSATAVRKEIRNNKH